MSYRDQTIREIPFESIECILGMHLILKPNGASTACINEPSIQTPTERG